MNETIIANWNSKVKPTDTVYHLGDISMKFTKPPKLIMSETLAILKRLHGNFIIIKGNHDQTALLKFLKQNNDITANQKPKFTIHEVGPELSLRIMKFF
ncbi:Putative uncharacterized protein [Leuconostoc citreum]|nr:Putative uncharacterized protein [Leuconostoc citreum]